MASQPKVPPAENPETTQPPAPKAEESQAPAVKTYQVVSTLLGYKFNANGVRDYRKEGESVRSDEFVPPAGITTEQLIAQYLSCGALVLV